MAPTPATRDKLVRLAPNRVLCGMDKCGRVASFLLYRFLGSSKPAVLAFCDSHAQEIAQELRVQVVPSVVERGRGFPGQKEDVWNLRQRERR